MVNEQYALKMIHLVLQAGCHQVVHCLFMDLAVQILPTRANLGGAFDVGILVGNRQAAFAINRMLFRRIKDLGIHEYPRLTNRLTVFAGFLKVDDQQPFWHADLYRGEPDTGGGIHRFEHVIDQLFEVSIERLDRRRDGFQPRIGHFENREYGHGVQIGIRQPEINRQGGAPAKLVPKCHRRDSRVRRPPARRGPIGSGGWGNFRAVRQDNAR